MISELQAVETVASLMALSARTAPKAKGVDTIVVRVLKGNDLKKLSSAMEAYGKKNNIGFFIRDSKNVAASLACVVIGVQGSVPVGVNCGACGYLTCDGMVKGRKNKSRKATAFSGPNCAIRMTDLGIAAGSAAKTAGIHNADNRIMYSAGVAALGLGFVGKNCTAAFGIPLSAAGKNIFFDRSG
jgi:uncharacterized ferredoxin-like protein